MKKRILLVDDFEDILDTLQQLLSGYEVVTARNGKEALSRAAAEKPDLVLLDVNLPDSNGVDLLEKMLAFEPAPLVIMLTGDDSVETAGRALGLGAFAYITKPFDGGQVEQQVEKAFAFLESKKRS